MRLHRRWQLLRVRGSSMLPTLHDGDIILVHNGNHHARPGVVAVVQLPGERPIAVKRLARRQADGWWVERDNPEQGVDSWLVGAIPPNDVLAVAIAIVWPRPRRLRARHWS